MTPLSAADAAAIWQVLVDHAGAYENPIPGGLRTRDTFVKVQSATLCEEYRFCGSLGFGGKFRRNRVWIGDMRTESWTVDCYREDLTDERQAVIDKTNEALAELRKENVT